MLAYGIYILLGDCFTSIWLAFVFSLYLRDLKALVEKTLANTIGWSDKSLLRKILIVRFIINVCKAYRKVGIKYVFTEILLYLKNLIFDKFDSNSKSFFSDVPKIMTIWGVYILLRYVGGPYSLLIFAIFLLVDLVLKFLIWSIRNIFKCIGFIKGEENYNRSYQIGKTASTTISYWVIFGMLLLILASFLFLIFLFFVDLNHLRENTMGSTSVFQLIDDNYLMIDKVDSYIKPHLKTFLKVVQYHSTLKYEYDKTFFENNTSFHIMKNFTSELNVTSPGDLPYYPLSFSPKNWTFWIFDRGELQRPKS